jgi:hypothetical protein
MPTAASRDASSASCLSGPLRHHAAACSAVKPYRLDHEAAIVRATGSARSGHCRTADAAVPVSGGPSFPGPRRAAGMIITGAASAVVTPALRHPEDVLDGGRHGVVFNTRGVPCPSSADPELLVGGSP